MAGRSQKKNANLERLLAQGEQARQAGDAPAANRLFRKAATLAPADPRPLFGRGQVALDTGQGRLAVSLLRQALARCAPPPPAAYHQELSCALEMVGALSDALVEALTATRLAPDDVGTRVQAGHLAIGLEDFSTAQRELEAALALAPDHPAVHLNMAAVLQAQDAPRAAERHCRQALALGMDHPAVWKTLAGTLMMLVRYREALEASERHLALAPEDPEGWAQQAFILQNLERYDEAQALLESRLAANPHDSLCWIALGHLRQERKDAQGALTALERAVAEDPGSVRARRALAGMLSSLGYLPQAEAEARAILALRPDDPHAHRTLAIALADLGRFAEADAALAVAGGTDQAPYVVAYMPDLTPEERRDRFAASAAARAPETPPVGREAFAHLDRDPHRRLRVGLVSGDFRLHVMAGFLMPVLRHLDPAAVSVEIFANQRHEDAISAEIRGLASAWHGIAADSEDEAVTRIRERNLDILVDLNGYVKGHRLDVFARRAAPVQVSWLGYANTTGLPTMDWFLADARLVPPGADSFFTERVWRLPRTFLCHTALEPLPDPGPLPAMQRGYVTFGHMGRPLRFSDATLRAWGRILAAVPGARLRLAQHCFADAVGRETFGARFAALGLDPQRVDMDCVSPPWPVYAEEVDVALDTFPVNAGTTTVDALRLGCPVLTCRGAPPVGRLGNSILHAAGMNDWIADDPEDYVARAVAAAGDLEALAALRARLPARLEHTALGDGPAMARDVTAALRGMWHWWLAEED